VLYPLLVFFPLLAPNCREVAREQPVAPPSGTYSQGHIALNAVQPHLGQYDMGADFFCFFSCFVFFFGRGHGFLTFSLSSITFPWFFIGFPSFFLTFSAFSSIFL
jgi:hypothetical protein